MLKKNAWRVWVEMGCVVVFFGSVLWGAESWRMLVAGASLVGMIGLRLAGLITLLSPLRWLCETISARRLEKREPTKRREWAKWVALGCVPTQLLAYWLWPAAPALVVVILVFLVALGCTLCALKAR